MIFMYFVFTAILSLASINRVKIWIYDRFKVRFRLEI